MKNPWPTIKFPIRITVSLISISWVVYVLTKIDWNMTKGSLSNLSVALLAACFCLSGLIYSTRLFRLRYWVGILSGAALSIGEWTHLYLKSIAFGSITPARLGDFSRIPLLEKTGLGLSARTRVTLYDKTADILYVPAGICLTSGIVGEKLDIPAGWLFTVGMLFLAAFLILFYRFARSLGIKGLLMGLAVTMAGLCLFILSNTFLFRSVGIHLNMLDIAAITLSAGIIASLPVSTGGLGVRECSLIYLLGLWGIQAEAAPPVLILEFILNMVFPVILYVCWVVCVNIKETLFGS